MKAQQGFIHEQKMFEFGFALYGMHPQCRSCPDNEVCPQYEAPSSTLKIYCKRHGLRAAAKRLGIPMVVEGE